MKLIGLSIVLVIMACVSGLCRAMNNNNTAMLNGAKNAFVACSNLEGVNIVDSGKVVCIRGKIDPTMFVGLLKLKDGIEQNPYVIISGMGGYADSSIYIVNMLDPYDPVPVIGDTCASACGQILMLMGRHRVLLHCADVVMHGGPTSVQAVLAQHYSDELTQRAVASISQFKDFYQDRHISMDMVTKPPEDIQKQINAGKIVFWPWSINKLRSFGVRGIVSENDPDEAVPSDYAQSCL